MLGCMAELSDYDIFDITIGGDPFTGVQTPVFDETKVPVMPQGGFLGAIMSAIHWLATWLGENVIYGGLNLWGLFVGFMDTIAAWLGFPNAFSNFISWLSSLGSWLVDSFTYLFSFFTSMFSFLSVTIGKMLNTLSTIIGQWVAMIQEFFFMLDTGYGYATGAWEMLGLSTWVVLAAILYPIWLLYKWEDEGLDAVINHVRMLLDIGAWVMNLFLNVIRLFLNLIGRIIESIPVVE